MSSSSSAPKMLHPEQDLSQNEPLDPWLRQKSEPALWYMRFKRYLEMGPKRSLRKALADEPDTQKATRGTKKNQETKKLSDVSVPGAWKRASKVWQWVERAEAYDLAQMEKQAAQIRKMASSTPYASKSYRIIKLDFCARVLMNLIKPGIELKWCLMVMARLQAVMDAIEKEMQGLDGVTLEMCDASAMLTINEEIVEQEFQKIIKGASIQQKNTAAFERNEALAKIGKQRI